MASEGAAAGGAAGFREPTRAIFVESDLRKFLGSTVGLVRPELAHCEPRCAD